MQIDNSHFELRLAAGEADLQAAQRLRYAVFVEELGGDGPLVDHAARREADRFDPFFDHLLLLDRRRAEQDRVAGVLPREWRGGRGPRRTLSIRRTKYVPVALALRPPPSGTGAAACIGD